MTVRPAQVSDRDALLKMWLDLWPDADREEHAAEIEAHFHGPPRSTLPLDMLVAEDDGRLEGFVEVGLRSHADGCDSRRPVAYIEGWYVTPEHRRSGVGRALIQAAERWGRSHGCVEVASDTWIDNKESQAAHEALGFEEVDRCVNYRKLLSRDASHG